MPEMADDADRSGLFAEIRNFSQRKLKKVETKVTTGSGEQVTEKRGAKGVQTLKKEGIQGTGYVVDNKPDLQVGMIIPGLFISSQDVAHDKKTLEAYEITHILNLAYGVENAFEDDYNYKKIEILDTPETDIKKYFNECFEFIDEARHYGNCLVHCNAGVSRCTTICTAYLMYKEKKTFTDALNAVREARPFSKPNAGFMKQLEEYNEELFGGGAKRDDKIEDAFTAKQKAEREAEKAAISGASSVKNKLKSFGAQLDAHFAERARSISPMPLPLKKKPQNDNKNQTPEPSKLKQEPPKRQDLPKPKPEPIKPKQEPPKKLVINNDTTNRPFNDLQTSPNIDETPISVSAFRKNFENINRNELPKVQTIPATPKTNAVNNSPWNRSQQQSVPAPAPAPEEKPKKKIIIKQRSKDVPEEQPKRRSTRDLVDAIERVNSPTVDQKPYRRRQTTDFNNTTNNKDITTKPIDNKQPISRRTRELVNEPPPPPPPPPPQVSSQPKQVSSRTIKLVKQPSIGSSPTPSSNKSNSISPQPPISNSPSPTPHDQQRDESVSGQPSKMVFGRVPPPRLSICGRTLSQATANISDVSNKVTNNDSRNSSISGHSASNSRSESPVLSAVVRTDANRKRESEEKVAKVAKVAAAADKLSDNMVAKRTTVLSEPVKNKSVVSKSSSPTSSSEEESESDEEVEVTVPKMTSTLTTKLSTNNNINNKNDAKEPEINARSVSPLTQTKESPKEPSKEPSTVNQSLVNRTPLGQTKDKQQSFDRKLEKSKSGLTRSSTAEILKLIKTKSRGDLVMATLDEDDEIDALLMGLENEGIDNVDWDELGVDYEEVKDIVENAKTQDSDQDSTDDEDSSDEDDDEDDEQAVHMVINRQAPQEDESDESDDEFEVVEDEEESD